MTRVNRNRISLNFFFNHIPSYSTSFGEEKKKKPYFNHEEEADDQSLAIPPLSQQGGQFPKGSRRRNGAHPQIGHPGSGSGRGLPSAEMANRVSAVKKMLTGFMMAGNSMKSN